MMKKKLFFTVAGLNIIWLTSCISGINNTSSYGYLYTSVKFPDKKFSVKFIPDNTNIINVQVDGVGLKTPIKFSLTRNDSSRVLSEVPSGEKLIRATALDINGKLLAQGQNSVNVIAKTFNKVEIVLEVPNINAPTNTATPSPNPTATESPVGILPSATPTPVSSNSSENSVCIVKIPLADFPLSKSLEQSILEAGCKIVLPTPSPPPSISNGGGGGSSGGGAVPPPVDNIPLSVSVRTASPTPSGITVTTN